VKRGRQRVGEFLDRQPDALLCLVALALATGLFFAFVSLNDANLPLRWTARDLQKRTSPPDARLLEANEAKALPISWTVETDMPWDAYLRWVTKQLEGRYVVTRSTNQLLEASRFRFRDCYNMQLELLEPGPPLRVRAALRVSQRSGETPEVR